MVMPITKETIAIPAILLVIGLLIFKKKKNETLASCNNRKRMA